MTSPATAPADDLLEADAPRLTRDAPVVQKIARAMAAADAAHRRLRAVLAASVGLSPLEFTSLIRIGEDGELTPKALAAHLDITTGAVTALTDRLVGAGLVERMPNPHDRRSLLLGLTETGGRARYTMYAQYFDAIARALDASPGVAVDEMADLLHSTEAAISETADAIEGTPTIRSGR